MIRALIRLAALASLSALPAYAQDAGLDPTALIGLPVVTSDGVAVGSAVSVQIDAQGRPTAIIARVETSGGETNVQLPIGATRPSDRDIRLNADDTHWRAFLSRNAAAIQSVAPEPTPPPAPPLAPPSTEPPAAASLGAEMAAAADALASGTPTVPPAAETPEPSAAAPAPPVTTEPTIELAVAEPEPIATAAALPAVEMETGAAAGLRPAMPETDRQLSILDTEYVVAAPDFVVPDAAADLAQLLSSSSISSDARGAGLTAEQRMLLQP